MLTFLISLSCTKGYHNLDRSIRVIEYHRKIIIANPRMFVFTVSFTVISFKDICQDFTLPSV
jgi:hypothetical protein